MPKTLFIVASLALITACAGGDSTADLAAAELAAAKPDRCDAYPIPWKPPAGARAAAASELAALSPSALLFWDDARAALTSIARLDVPLAGCRDGADASAQIRKLISAHRLLFQIEAGEWTWPDRLDCRVVTADSPIDLTLSRKRIDGHPIEEDIFQVSLRRVDGIVKVSSVFGFYLPAFGPTLAPDLSRCDALTDKEAVAATAALGLEAPVYQGENFCQPSSTLRYVLRRNDDVRLKKAEWAWGDDGSGIVLTGTRTLRVTVDPANYTPELLASGARCPVGDGNDFTVGWDVTLDLHTGEVLFIQPGLDCVVC